MLGHQSPLNPPSVQDYSFSVQPGEHRVTPWQGYNLTGLSDVRSAGVEDRRAELAVVGKDLRDGHAERHWQDDEPELEQTMLEYPQSRYKNLFESAPDVYLVTDLEGTIRTINTAAERLLGISGDRARGKPLTILVPPHQHHMFLRVLDDIALQNDATTWDFDLLAQGGTVTPVTARLVRTQTRIGQSAVLWMIRDMSIQVAAQEQLRLANQDLSQRIMARTAALEQIFQRESRVNQENVEFLALLSHELRTPLHALMAYTELIERGIHGPVTELQCKDLQRMRYGHDQILGLVNRILDLARLESKQMMLEPENIRVANIVRVVLDILQPKCAATGVRCLEPKGPEHIAVRADIEALRQVLINLIGNAITFNIPEGTVEIFWECINNQVGIHIHDTGPGIAPCDIDLIFKPFAKILTSKCDRSGAGLSLPISRALAQAMQGRLEVQSTMGTGSTFSLWLPDVHGEESGVA